VLTRWERPLSVGKQLHLRTRLTSAGDESRRAVLMAAGASAAVCGPLAAATLLLSDAPSQKDGRKLRPERVIAASVKHGLGLPQHLDVGGVGRGPGSPPRQLQSAQRRASFDPGAL
jgi:hypothetical protein